MHSGQQEVNVQMLLAWSLETHSRAWRKWKVGRGHLLGEVAAIEAPSTSLDLCIRFHSFNTMEHFARSSLRATRSHVLRQAARRQTRSFTSIPPFPPTYNATPLKPPSSALPMPFVTETVGGGWHTCTWYWSPHIVIRANRDSQR